MIKYFIKLSTFILLIIILYGTLPSISNAQEVNLISNGDLEISDNTGTKPDGWMSNAWGTNQAKFTYPVTGINNGKAAKVEITSLSNGDAKWYFNDVPVNPGQQYTFTDNYISNVPTELVARYKLSDGSFEYVYMATVPASTTWNTISSTITIPDGVNSITIFHLIEQVGELTIDNANLQTDGDTPPVEDPPIEDPPVEDPPVEDPPVEDPPVEDPPVEDPPVEDPPVEDPPVEDPPAEDPPVEDPPAENPENLILNSDLENNSSDGTKPTNWLSNSWGTNQATFFYPANGVNGSKAVKVDMTSYSNGDAKWYFDDVTVNPGEKYTFTDKYKATVSTELVARYKMGNGSFSYAYISYVPPASSWDTITTTFTIPDNVVSMTMFHLIAQVGTLVIDDVSLSTDAPVVDPPVVTSGMVTLTFDDGWLSTYQNGIPILNAAGLVSSHGMITNYTDYEGYMNPAQIIELKNQGHEILSHSRTHPSLPSLSESQVRFEVTGSYDDLTSMGVENVKTFVYPYGEYNGLSQQIVKETYSSALSTNSGFNDPNSDPYLLKRQTIVDTTDVSEIESWIDQARNDGTWVILMFHKIENNGGTWSTTPNDLQEIVDHIVKSGTDTVTISEGVDVLGL